MQCDLQMKLKHNEHVIVTISSVCEMKKKSLIYLLINSELTNIMTKFKNFIISFLNNLLIFFFSPRKAVVAYVSSGKLLRVPLK